VAGFDVKPGYNKRMAPHLTPRQLDQIVQKISPGGRLIKANLLAGGLSTGMTLLEIETAGGAALRVVLRQPGKWALRQNPAAARDEFRLLEILHPLGLHTPSPILLDESSEIHSSPFLVIEFIEGEILIAAEKPVERAGQLAEHLAAIHAVMVEQLGLGFLPKLPSNLDQLAPTRSEPLTALIDEEPIRRALAIAWPIETGNAPTLLHGDFWPGNTVWQNGRLVRVIDWEEACIGEPLWDVAIARLDILLMFGFEVTEVFTETYLSKSNTRFAALPWFDLLAALRMSRMAAPDLAGWVTFFHPYERFDITEQSMRERTSAFVSQAFQQLFIEP